MLKNIIIPVDDSKLVHAMLKKFSKLIDLYNPAISLVYVSEPFMPEIYPESSLSKYYVNVEDYKKSCQKYAEKLFLKAKKQLGNVTQCNTLHIYRGDVSEGILYAAKKVKADTIVMASHRYSGVKGIVLGNNVNKVIVNSKLPILVL